MSGNSINIRSIALFLSICQSCLALECHQLITTSIGLFRTLTASLDEVGNLSYLNDGFSVENGIRIPQFSKYGRSVLINGAGHPQGLSSLVHPTQNDGIFALVDSRGLLRLVLGDGREVFIESPNYKNIAAAILFRPKLRDFQREVLAIRGLRGDPNAPPGTIVWKKTQSHNSSLCSFLYVVAGEGIYRAEISQRSLGDLPESVRLELMQGNMVQWVRSEPLVGGKPSTKVNVINGPVVNLRKIKNQKFSIVFRGLSLSEVIELTPFEAVLSLDPEVFPKAIDYFQVLNERRIVLGSELGGVFIVDTTANKVARQLITPSSIWIRSLSAHQLGDSIHIWAIDAVSKKILHWNSSMPTNQLLPYSKQLPNGVSPIFVVSTGELVPAGYDLPNPSPTGYFSNIAEGRHEVEIERVLVTGEDGKIYAFAPVEFRDKFVVAPPRPEREWISHEFDASR
jgi:hypothetical protein